MMLLLALALPGAAGLPELEAAADAFDAAQQRGDATALERMMAPDMVYISGSGAVRGRSAFVAGFADPGVRMDPFVIRNRRVVMLGPDVVAVTADAMIAQRSAGRRSAKALRYSDVFRRTAAGWRVVYVQVTPLAGLPATDAPR